MQARSVHAEIIGARVVVIERAQGLEHAVARLAEVVGAGIAVIAHHRGVGAVAAEALVNGARVVVRAVHGRELAVAAHAGIVGAGVTVIADDRLVLADAPRLAKVLRARVVVFAFVRMGAGGRAQIIRAGIIIGTSEGDVNGVRAIYVIGGYNMIISERNVSPCYIRALRVIPLTYVRTVIADIQIRIPLVVTGKGRYVCVDDIVIAVGDRLLHILNFHPARRTIHHGNRCVVVTDGIAGNDDLIVA